MSRLNKGKNCQPCRRKKPHILAVTELRKIATEVPVVVTPPENVLQGIGLILSAYAFMEWRLSVVLFTLLGLDHPEGRVAFGYVSPGARLEKIRGLLDWNGVQSTVDVKSLATAIADVTTIRDQLAHGIWAERGTHVVLQTIRHYTESDGVRIRHDFLPGSIDVSGNYFEDKCSAILDVITRIDELLETAEKVQADRRAAILEKGRRES